MAVKLRLQRHGKKGKPFFHIVAADSRSPRDGKFIERIGSYNPNTNPATIQLDNDKAISWLNNGAQPTDTVRAMLSYTGVMLRQHLTKGIAKGAMTQEEADKKFEAWITEKSNKIQAKKDGLVKAKTDAISDALKYEREVNQKRLKAMTAAAESASAQAHAEEAVAVAEVAPAAVAEVAPAVVAEVAPAVVAEVAPAAVAEEAPAVVAEEAPAVEEAPATDAPAEESTEA